MKKIKCRNKVLERLNDIHQKWQTGRQTVHNHHNDNTHLIYSTSK